MPFFPEKVMLRSRKNQKKARFYSFDDNSKSLRLLDGDSESNQILKRNADIDIPIYNITN